MHVHKNQQYAKFLYVYYPTFLAEIAKKKKLYSDLRRLFQKILVLQKVLLLGSQNACMDRDSQTWKGVFVKHSV